MSATRWLPADCLRVSALPLLLAYKVREAVDEAILDAEALRLAYQQTALFAGAELTAQNYRRIQVLQEVAVGLGHMLHCGAYADRHRWAAAVTTERLLCAMAGETDDLAEVCLELACIFRATPRPAMARRRSYRTRPDHLPPL